MFLSLLSIAEEYTNKQIDLIDAIRTCQSKGWLRDDFYVKDSPRILQFYTGKEWSRKSVSSLPKVIADNEYTVQIVYNRRTGFTHYKRRYFDTLHDSVTVKEGIIQGYYIYTAKE